MRCYINPPQPYFFTKGMCTEEIARNIKELNQEEAARLCAHRTREVVLDGYGRPVYEVCRSCGKRL